MSEKKNDVEFISTETEEQFVISDEEIYGCQDIDFLDAGAAVDEGETSDMLTSPRRDSDSNSDYNADIEDHTYTSFKDRKEDDDDDYGMALDDDIVKNVLDGSEDRMRGRTNEKFKKHCAYSLTVFCVVFLFLVIINSDLMERRDIQQHGTAFHYDDEDKFLETPGGTVFDTPVKYSGKLPIRSGYNHFVDIRGPAFRQGDEIPFFFDQKDGSNVVEDILSQCLGLVIAGTLLRVPDTLEGSVSCFLLLVILMQSNH